MNNQQGSLLVTLLFIMAFVSLLAIPVLQLTALEQKAAINGQVALQALYIAEAGLNKAEARVLSGSVNSTTLIGSLGNGGYITEVQNEGDRIMLSSTGRVGSIQRAVHRELIPQTNLFSLKTAAYAIGKIEVRKGTIDGSVGTTSLQPGAVQVTHNHGEITQNVYISPLANNNVVSGLDAGKIIRQVDEIKLPQPKFPAFPDGLPFVSGYAGTTISSDMHIGKLSVKKDTLVLNATHNDLVIIVDVLELDNNSSLEVRGTNQVKLYVTNQLDLGNGVSVNKDRPPELLSVYVAGSLSTKNNGDLSCNLIIKDAELSLGNNFEMRGHIVTGGSLLDIGINSFGDGQVIYAPVADVYLGTNSGLRGIIIAEQLKLDNNTKLIFTDELSVPPEISQLLGSSYRRGPWRIGP